MKWEQYRSVMERYAIKTDDMATEDAYFMATHMPFTQLEFHEDGRTSSVPKLLSEDEVFAKLTDNPDDKDRMVIVRGDNGTGKSHLIRYLKAKLEMSPSTVYNPATEQLIFLRRLNNSTRGAFSQLLEQKVISDPDIQDKMKKFIDSSEAKDEASFKVDILFSYVSAVSSDQTGKTYKPVICRDIASYLSDSRVREHLLREDGAIARCYSIITAPSNQVLKDTTIFTGDDFNVNKILRAVIKQGDPQASDFASTLKGDEYEINRLVQYLNRFTRDVVQRCAGISSENVKSIFTQLRKDLKKQGKNLTLFIEDFTGFTGIDSELITALSTEHGGQGSGYTDLCRVTSIIGITNDYYDQFRDNFTDRVTHQISVTDRSYGTDEFLVHMAACYLNAIYCDPAELRKWNDDGASLSDLPISSFSTPCTWENASIEGKQMTLYPFNSRSLLALYESLPVKSPRMFLKDVIRAQLKEYFDGKLYGDDWYFPMNPGNIQMAKDPHSSAIDRLDTFAVSDKNRLKSVFALWGDGSASGIKEANGEVLFGGVNQKFLDDIGLGAFTGIGEIIDKASGKAVQPASTNPPPDKKTAEKSDTEPIPTPKVKQHIDGATKAYLKFKDDITAWFTKEEPLKFDQDYREWLRDFIKGTAKQSGAINWQDQGIPAYFAEERLSDLGCYYIDDQSTPTNRDKAIVYMDRSIESRDALLALNEWNYARGWEFDESVYYQQRLITWLERRRSVITEKVIATKSNEAQLPVLEWCLALQYLKACILGYKVDTSSPYAVVESLFKDFKKQDSIKRDTREWNDLIQFVMNKKSEFDSAFSMLKRASATTMGAVHFSVDSNTKSCYRTYDLLKAAEKLMNANWDIEQELPADIPQRHLLFNPANLLKILYPNIQKAMLAETSQDESVLNGIRGYVGDLNKSNMISTFAAIQELFAVFSANSIIGSNDLRTKYDGAPIEKATLLLKHVALLESAASMPPVMQLTQYSENSLNVLFDFLRDMQTIARKAEQEEAKANKDIEKAGGSTATDQLSKIALEAMEKLYDQIDQMEVNVNATD